MSSDKDETHYGEVVGFVHLPMVNPQKPLGVHSNDEPLPNVWAIIAEERTGTMCTAPIYNVKKAAAQGGK